MECTCKTGIHNLQSAKCMKHPSVVQKYVIVESFKADGSINGIDLSSTFAESQIDALLTQSDKALRWYLSDQIEAFVTERADPNTETIGNVNFTTSQGARTMSSDFLVSSAELATKLEANNCVDISVYLIDEDNGITGVVTRNNFLDPIRLERNAVSKVVFATEANIFKVSFATTWQKNVRDGNIRTLGFSSHATDILNKKGLIDVKASAAASVTANTATVTYRTVDGSALGSEFKGLLVGDFASKNTTTDLAVVISAAVENPDGTYLLTFAAQTAADLGTITATNAGFEFAVPVITYQ